MSKKANRYSNLKLILRIVTLAIAIWALIVAYEARSIAEWNTNTIENIIEKTLFK